MTNMPAPTAPTAPDYEGAFRGALTATRLNRAHAALAEHAARSKRSDSGLMVVAMSYPDEKVQNAAVSLFHARTGQHPDGATECKGCDIEAAVVLLDDLSQPA